MKHPEDHPRRILLAVTGLSPQIVTETVYALAVAPVPPRRLFVPTEIRLITTKEGAESAKLSLLHPDSGWFHRLCADYELPPIAFEPEHIRVLEDAAGRPLDDIRTPADNTRAADTITEVVRELTRDGESALHVSIAGGRKTMGFYLGYALSLYGRTQDRLSHVLVSSPYESHPEFYYPPPRSMLIHTSGRNGRPYDARDAEVNLAEIPFVRLREGLNPGLMEGTASFSEVVAEAQRALPPLGLELDPGNCMVTAGSEPFQMRPAHFAFYWMLAERARRGRPGAHWSECGIEQELLDYYGRVVNPASGDYERAERAYARGVTAENVNPTKAHIKEVLEAAPGPLAGGAVPRQGAGAHSRHAVPPFRSGPAAARDSHCGRQGCGTGRWGRESGQLSRGAIVMQPMQQMKYEVRFLTPAFLGNAEQSGQWRTPPFKALLRQWWRVAYAAKKEFRVDVRQMRRDEGLLFGNAWLSHEENGRTVKDFCKSLVRMRLNRWTVGELRRWDGLEQETVFHPGSPEDQMPGWTARISGIRAARWSWRYQARQAERGNQVRRDRDLGDCGSRRLC